MKRSSSLKSGRDPRAQQEGSDLVASVRIKLVAGCGGCLRRVCGSVLFEVKLTVRIGNLEERKFDDAIFPPNFKACEPLLMATFWMKSQTLLYSLDGSQSFAPIWV